MRRSRAVGRTTKRPELDELAEHIPHTATLEDLVLLPQTRGLIDQLIVEARGPSPLSAGSTAGTRTTHSPGVTALFAGDDGASKTLAAEALASELDFDLYRIDLSGMNQRYPRRRRG